MSSHQDPSPATEQFRMADTDIIRYSDIITALHIYKWTHVYKAHVQSRCRFGGHFYNELELIRSTQINFTTAN